MASTDLRHELNCPICLEVYKDPVTLGCGHSFCLGCIHHQIGNHGRSRAYNCPQCRQPSKSALKKNIVLSRLAERFHGGQPDEGRKVVFCVYCDFPVPAVKSCRQCETSLCADHLRKHNETVEHTLLPPTADLGKRRCPVHGKIMEYYCTEDSVCVCASCRLDGEHTGHQAESLEEVSKKKIRPLLEKVILEREKIEKKVQSLQERGTKAQEVATEATQRATAKLRDIKKQLEDLEKMVPDEISRWEMQISQMVSGLTQQLQTKKDDLSRKISHLEGLRDLADPITVLQNQELDKDLCDMEEALPDDPEFPDLQEDLISSSLHKLCDIVTNAKMWIQKPADIILDIRTAANNLWISDDLKSVFRSDTELPYPKTPERLQSCEVLSLSSFSSWRHLWEVDTSKSESWKVGMCYPSISRETRISMVGRDKDSWCLRRCRDNYTMMHDGEHIHLSHKASSHKFRIYLDYEAGQLSFFEVGDPMRHLHTFKATFSEPLHAVLGVFQGFITICN
ncbi:E3 ubiquitin/ISG15 ligase TRIM25-like [Lithobates pipiens]